MKKLSNLIWSLKFYFGTLFSKVKFTKAFHRFEKKTDMRQAQEAKRRARYEMHSLLKVGDTYKLGEGTCTLAKFGVEGKEEVKKKIEAADARREERRRILTARAEEIMLMKPDELVQFQLEKWFKERKDFTEKVSGFKKLTKEESRHEAPPPDRKH